MPIAIDCSNISVNKSYNHLWTNSIYGLSLLKFDEAICMTVYDSSTYQIFHSEKGNYIYDKEKEKVYSLTIDSWTRLVLKIAR